MASLFEQFATDNKAEVEGTVITFGDGVTFRIARMGKSNKRYQKLVETEMKKHKVAIRNDNLSTEVDEAITLDVFLRTVLLGWDGVKYDERMGTMPDGVGDGGFIPFTYRNAEALMKALPELYSNLREQATSLSNFRSQEINADSKT